MTAFFCKLNACKKTLFCNFNQLLCLFANLSDANCSCGI